MVNPLQGTNLIVAVGSIDGIAGTAACIRHSKNPEIQIIFTQAFQVDTIDPSQWPSNSKVGFIDLGVNNKNPNMTINFLIKIYTLGHTILFIADEHEKNDWEYVLNQCRHTIQELTIQPQDRSDYSSSCKILETAFGDSADTHTKALLFAGDEADQMNFNTYFGEIFNQSVKSNKNDPFRRPYLARYFAQEIKPDSFILKWMNQYAEMAACLPQILNARHYLGYGIFLYDGRQAPHDATMLFSEAYKTSPIVILMGERGVSIGTQNKNLDLLTLIKTTGIKASGMASKVNLSFFDLHRAIGALIALFIYNKKT
jgi:hypothetical protein